MHKLLLPRDTKCIKKKKKQRDFNPGDTVSDPDETVNKMGILSDIQALWLYLKSPFGFASFLHLRTENKL